ncbi:MAG: NADH-quinone oxidoreductase subunit A [Alcanivoracaceae bacterium]|nr:NADH-quinone oxidoreductase subunit A [Alcanivoracaceae bacterium]
MLENYIPILVFVGVMIVFSAALIVVSKVVAWFTGVTNPNAVKNDAFECGFKPFAEARAKFDVRFYLVAILFIVFDLEVAFLFPWAVVAGKIGWYGFIGMGVFILLLVIGFVYEWFKGALEWE